MKADNSFETTGHNRIIKITEIPQDHPTDLTELTIDIRYVGPGGAFEGIALDHHIIPAIMRAFNGDNGDNSC